MTVLIDHQSQLCGRQAPSSPISRPCEKQTPHTVFRFQAMGRKGGGRKAFLKTAKAAEDDDAEAPPAQTNDSKVADGPPAVATEDPSAKFLIGDNAASPEAKEAPVQDKSSSGPLPNGSKKNVEKADVQEETRGQLVQRHKKVCLSTCDSCQVHIIFELELLLGEHAGLPHPALTKPA